ncbi:MAG TPA: ABC transporter permease [Dehalococcoidia bacterium]|nr:ABC transporter permease [Dehalococcoidia bacterium]
MIGNIIKKEFKELFTLSTLLPIVVIAIVFAFVGQTIGNIGETMEEKPVVGIVDMDDGDFSDIAMAVLIEKAEVIYDGNDAEEGLEEVREENGVALLVIPENFSQNIYANHPGEIEIYWIMKGAGMMDSISSGAVEGLIQSVNQEISRELIQQDSSFDPALVLAPTTRVETTFFKGKEVEGLSSSQLGNMLSSQSIVIPIVVMMLIIMAGASVISSMGMEKENKTLETLLTLPVRRSHIVIGKIVGSALVGMIMAAIYMIGFSRYMSSFQISDINLADFGLALGMQDYLLIGISLFTALLAGLSLCIVLGTFAKNYRSAQTLIFPITALAMISVFITMFKDFDTIPAILRVLVFAIPFSHPMMAMRALMMDNYSLVIGGVAYTAVFTVIMIVVAVRIFNSDRLLTGSVQKRAGWGKLGWGFRR